MLVGERMTKNPLTIHEDANVEDGLHLMRERKVRRLPVVDRAGRLVGIVSDKDLLHAAPSPATSLSVHELHYLLSKLTVKRVMSSPVITVTPQMPLEQAACVMTDHRIGGVPVMEGRDLVGIITETDIFKVLIEMLAARVPGVRATIAAQEGVGVLARIAKSLADRGANILSVVTYHGSGPDETLLTMKISQAEPAVIRSALESAGVRVVDLRESATSCESVSPS
jgi:acetoin utilization protein AcuB